MTSNYPTSIDSFNDPLSNSPLNNPSHAGQHQDLNDAVEKLETKLGVTASPAASASAGHVLTATGSGSTWQAPAVTAAQFANVGLTFITSTTATSGTIAIDNCFTTTYDSYRVVILQTNVTATGTTLFRFRAGGTPITTDYYYGGSVFRYNSNGEYWYGGPTNAFVTMIATTGNQVQCAIDLSFPRASQRKGFVAECTASYSSYIGTTLHGIVNLTANNYDGMQITQDAGGTITATVTIFGYKKG